MPLFIDHGCQCITITCLRHNSINMIQKCVVWVCGCSLFYQSLKIKRKAWIFFQNCSAHKNSMAVIKIKWGKKDVLLSCPLI